MEYSSVIFILFPYLLQFLIFILLILTVYTSVFWFNYSLGVCDLVWSPYAKSGGQYVTHNTWTVDIYFHIVPRLLQKVPSSLALLLLLFTYQAHDKPLSQLVSYSKKAFEIYMSSAPAHTRLYSSTLGRLPDWTTRKTDRLLAGNHLGKAITSLYGVAPSHRRIQQHATDLHVCPTPCAGHCLMTPGDMGQRFFDLWRKIQCCFARRRKDKGSTTIHAPTLV